MKEYRITLILCGKGFQPNHYATLIFRVYRLTTRLLKIHTDKMKEDNPNITDFTIINVLELDIED